jgi:non-lysosomal glucosylceramidase
MGCCSNESNSVSTCRPDHGLSRRTFIRRVGAGTIITLGAGLPAFADPLDNPNFDVNIPEDKKLTPEWIKALYERGEPEVYSKLQLDKVAMPIGGICAGQVYLSPDGRLVEWRVNQTPVELQHGFALRTVTGGKTDIHPLTRETFPDLTFRGEYPIAKIEYQNATLPVQVSLEAFSPFEPLHADDSGLPATVFHFTLKNTSSAPVEATLAGGLENGCVLQNRESVPGTRRNQITRGSDLTVLACTGSAQPPDPTAKPRPDIIFEDWNKATFDGWTVEGTAFGPGPIPRGQVEKEMGPMGGEGPGLVNSYLPTHNDAATGKLTSAPFTISRNYIGIWLGGGNMVGKVGVNLLVDGKIVQSRTGAQENKLTLHFLDVRSFQGKQGVLEIFDNSSDTWAQVGAGRITFTDVLANPLPLEQLPDFGSTALALLGAPAELGLAKGSIGFDGEPGDDASVSLAERLIGTLGRTVQLAPGASADVTFVVAWHFPNVTIGKLANVGRHYATRFDSAPVAARHVAANFDKFAASTRLWRDTWYDSTLPYWFLDRTFLNTSTLATSGCFRFANGRFWAWEGGPDCCAGTCTHVWQYAHSMGRVFPELERDTRERVDLGISLIPATGVMGFRGEFDMSLAVDGQAGTILRIYREHQMSPDNAFLKRNWDKIKLVYNPLFALDPNEEGIMNGPQMNTLDRVWFGQISWMSSMYCAAVRAGEHMAREMGDNDFADKCAKIADAGFKNIPARLFNGEYFFSIPDPKHLDTVNSGDGSYIDQVYGQSTAFQLGLPRILPEKETRTALASLWKYNFSPDAGAYFESKHTGRRFVSPGDAGLIMCTFPRTDWDYVKASGGGDPSHGNFAYYFVECWTGNEYQVACHLLWEGMVQEGLAVVRAIHERYGPLRRNPWNEIECGDHYSRAMGSHSPFLAACGFSHHGPQGLIGFAPKISPENFRTPFIACEGWGTYAQTIASGKMSASLELKSGQLRIQTLTLALDSASGPNIQVTATLGNDTVAASGTLADGRVEIKFPNGVTIPTGGKLKVEIA